MEQTQPKESARWRFAFAGFRHSHIMSLYKAVMNHPQMAIVAACEEDAQTAETLRQQGAVALTHDSLDRMLEEVESDVIAIGDHYGARGGIAIKALRAGRHVLADKPLCTRLEELEEIERLAREKGLSAGCMLDMRNSPAMQVMRRLIGEDVIGQVHTITFLGQHPLLLGKRPSWYFEPDQHGGTINDIAIHAIDAIPWITGRRITVVHAARCWNAKVPQYPHFEDGAQFLAELDNGGGLMGDVSYLAPDGCGYSAPQYWRFTIHGSQGVLEATSSDKTVQVATHEDEAPRQVAVQPRPPGYRPLEDLILEIQGKPSPAGLTTAAVIDASRRALLIQKAADQKEYAVKL